jgi:hypothetical protein
MRNPIPFVMGVIVAVGFTAPVNAQFADDNVKSDGLGNTAVGTDALFTLTPSTEASLDCDGSICTSNTAVGNNALFSNTAGSDNVGVGAGALEIAYRRSESERSGGSSEMSY